MPDIVHTEVCTEALEDVGFEVQETRDVALDQGHDNWKNSEIIV